MTKERFVCESIDKALAYCFNPAINFKRFNRFLNRIEAKLVSYVLKEKMSYNEFAQTDEILVRMKSKKQERLARLGLI